MKLLLSKRTSVAQQMEGGEHAEDQQTGSGHMLAEEPAAAEQLREEPALEDSGSGAIEGLTRRSASMWTSDEKGSFLSCFKVRPLHRTRSWVTIYLLDIAREMISRPALLTGACLG